MGSVSGDTREFFEQLVSIVSSASSKYGFESQKLGFSPIGHTLQETSMEPKNRGLEDDFPFQTGDFQVPC